MQELVELIVGKYDGSLKAEHGTGANMAPYVRARVGHQGDGDDVADQAARGSRRDPRSGDRAEPRSGSAPAAPEVDARIEGAATKCIECGFCEPGCPSRNVTTTPRQRIVLRREIARQQPDSPVRTALESEYRYDAIETCAADGSCAAACPVGIDTGQLIKDLRTRGHTSRAERVAERVAARFELAERAARVGVRVGGRAGRAAGRERASPGSAPAPTDGADGRRRRIHAGLHQPDLRQSARDRPAPDAARGTRVALGPRGEAALDPAGRRRALLRDPVELKGLRPGPRADARQTQCSAPALDRRRRASARDRRELLRARGP